MSGCRDIGRSSVTAACGFPAAGNTAPCISCMLIRMIGIVGDGRRGGATPFHRRYRKPSLALPLSVLSGFPVFWVGRNDGYGMVGIGPTSHTEVECECRTNVCFSTVFTCLFTALERSFASHLLIGRFFRHISCCKLLAERHRIIICAGRGCSRE